MSWEKPKTGFKTADCFHNLGLEKVEFFAPQWRKRPLYNRQVFFDTAGAIDTFLVVDKKSLELFVFFDAFESDRKRPRILKLCKLSKNYAEAVPQMTMYETALIRLFDKHRTYDSLYAAVKALTTSAKLKKALEL